MAILAVLKRDPVIIHSSIHPYTLFHRTQIRPTSKKRKKYTRILKGFNGTERRVALTTAHNVSATVEKIAHLNR